VRGSEKTRQAADKALYAVFGLAAALSGADADAAMRPVDGMAPQLSANARDAQAQSVEETRRVFVNFAGTALNLAAANSPDDATRNITRMSELAHALDGYGGTATQREAILQAVRGDWDAYNVVVTDRRPASGDYVMNHVGPNRPDDMGSKILGIAHLDCGDKMMRNDVSFAFHHAGDGHQPSSVAMTISQEVAHAFGLEHVDDPNDIMFPARGAADPSFVDGCSPVVPAEGIGIACTEQHIESCGASDMQNSHAELMMLLGPARTDDVPPTVSIGDGMEALAVPMGDEFRLAITADDDVLVDHVVLYLDGEKVADDTTAPFGWKMSDIEAGEYEFYVEAFDMAGNSTMSEPVAVYVGIEPPEGVEAESPYADSEDIGGETMVGCGCNTTGDDVPQLGWALLLLPLALRRRRR
jgi:MYXO-CTERM domain-containing protein